MKNSDNLENQDDKVKKLEKELDRFQRRNKVLKKRLIKLQNENKNLSEELEILDKQKINKVSEEEGANKLICPHCGSELEYGDAYAGKTYVICSRFPLCKYRTVR